MRQKVLTVLCAPMLTSVCAVSLAAQGKKPVSTWELTVEWRVEGAADGSAGFDHVTDLRVIPGKGFVYLDATGGLRQPRRHLGGGGNDA